jgi:hypothetical protein
MNNQEKTHEDESGAESFKFTQRGYMWLNPETLKWSYCNPAFSLRSLADVKRITDLEKVLLATPNTHSDEWSDYVCTFCSASDSSHEDDCVYLLAINLRNKALKEPKL